MKKLLKITQTFSDGSTVSQTTEFPVFQVPALERSLQSQVGAKIFTRKFLWIKFAPKTIVGFKIEEVL